jgi:Abortive infection C-terminus
VPAQSPVFDAAKELLLMMIGRATGDDTLPKAPFAAARQRVMSDPIGAKLAPECVRVCREPNNVWTYIKGQQPELPTYQSRRDFLHGEFEPLLAALERFDGSPLDDIVDDALDELDSTSVTAAWSKAAERRATDPTGAITAARTLLESVCKTILDDAGETYTGKDDLPALYRKAAEALTLAPTDYSDEQIRRILGGATTVVEGVGSLRNRHGDAHGEGRTTYRLGERHATLVVNMAGAMALFLVQTFEARDIDGR